MKKKVKFSRGELTKKIIIAAGVVVGFSASLVMPGLPIGLKAILEVIEEGKPNREQTRTVLKRLEKQKIISLKEKEGEIWVTFRKRGKDLLVKYKIDDLKIEKPKRWDRKWRVVIFDIPEKKKLAREVLREKLKDLGFRAIQRSVFIHPYDCQKEIELIKKVYEIDPYVQLIVAESIDGEKRLIRKFKL